MSFLKGYMQLTFKFQESYFFFFLNECGIGVVAALEVTPQCSPEDATCRWLAVQLRVNDSIHNSGGAVSL